LRYWIAFLFASALSLVGFLLAFAVPSEGWRPVSMPFRVVNITSVADTLWVCGADEMIAKSEDGGQVWQVKHQRADGEVLLRVGFVTDKIGYGAGTNGLVLWTKDGGETWSSRNAGPETILDISFADDKHGIRHTRSAVELTDDGGVTWTPISALQSNQELEKFKIVFAVAALDSNHAVILLKEGPYSDQIFFITVDGGKTWKTTYIPNVGIRSLVVHNAEYWAFGLEVIEKDKPGGGYSVPLALHSMDGVNWLHGVRAPNEYSHCNAQGCILWDGAIVELYQEKPLFSALPADGSLTPVWAAAKGRVCSIGSVLKCASARPSNAPPPRPEMNRPVSQSLESPAPAPGCLVCRLDSFPVRKDLVGRGLLDVDFLVRKDGTVGDVKVQHASAKELESSVARVVEAWIFEPPRQGDAPVEKRQNIKLGLVCFAFPTNEEATCSLISSRSEIGVRKEAPIDPQLKTDILRLLDVMHFREKAAEEGRAIFQSTRPALIASLPSTPNREKIVDAYIEKLLALLQSADYMDRVVATYAKRFTDDDIKGITKFFETPAGQHFGIVSSQLSGDLNRIGQQLAFENMARIMKELCEDYPELQRTAKICPQNGTDKKSLLPQPKPPSPGESLPRTPPNTVSRQMPYPESAGGLRQLLEDVLAAIQAGEDQEVSELLTSLTVPNSPAWFAKVFGPEQRAQLAGSYDYRFREDEERMRALLSALASKKGELVIRRVTNSPEPGEGLSAKTLRESLKEPVVFYSANWRTSPDSPGIPIRYFVFVDNAFRFIDSGVLLTLSSFNRPEHSGRFAVPKRVRVGAAVIAAMVTNKVAPYYPPEAKEQRIQGTVRLQALIAEDGAVQELDWMEGDPILAEAAIAAVRQWRYRPMLIKGVQVEVQSTVDVVFTLDQASPTTDTPMLPPTQESRGIAGPE